jgi:hypothetical protein
MKKGNVGNSFMKVSSFLVKPVHCTGTRADWKVASLWLIEILVFFCFHSFLVFSLGKQHFFSLNNPLRLVNIPTKTMSWDYILYYIPFQTLSFFFCFGLIFSSMFFFSPNLCLSLNPYCDLLIYKFFSKECTLPFACEEFQVFHFGGSNYHYQLIFKWIYFIVLKLFFLLFKCCSFFNCLIIRHIKVI